MWQAIKAYAPPGLLKSCDRNCFEGYVVLVHARAVAIQRWNETNFSILVRGGDDRHHRNIVNPYLKEVRRLTEQCRILEGEFGFTPAARSRISLGQAEEPNDPASRFLT